jgi:hypothetical protein
VRALLLFFAFMLANVAAGAGSLDQCREKEKNEERVKACIDEEYRRSRNMLRKMNLSVLEAINAETQEDGRKGRQREYRAAQVRHFRNRAAICSKHPAGFRRKACESDMNSVHMDRLSQFTYSGR